MATIVKDESLMVEEKLQFVLEDLKKSDLKKFKWYLTDIPKGKLETAIPHEIVDILIDRYEPIGSLDVTVKTLKKINQNNLAKELAAFKASMPDSINQDVMGKTALNCQKELKQILIGENQNGDKGNALNQILDVYLTDEGDDSDQHERSDNDNTSRVIPLTTIFDPLPERQSPPRLVLSKGVAGIGKTIAIRKFTLDWAEDKSNHDIQFVFPFFFRELNVIKKDQSFNELIHMFYPHTKHYRLDYNKFKVLIILEGLDEYSCSSFNFHATCRDLTVPVPVKQLLTGLIKKGCLLPKALVWITTRPEAVVHIPEQCIDRVTAFQGFSDAQKEEFFRMNIHDEGSSESVIKHIKTTPFLHTLCNIPVYCVMAASVLGRMMADKDDREFPKTVTELYIYYLVEELKRNILQRSGNHDIDLKSYQNVVMSLGKIAYKKLRDGKVTFSQEDLKDCGIDVQTDQLKMCQHILKKGKDGYAFEHLSIQEFLAALYAFLSFYNGEGDVINLTCKDKANALLNKKSSGFLKRTVNTVLENRKGNMHNFLRFFLGLTLESNQTCLGDLMQENDRKSEKKSKEKIVDHIKKTIRKTASPETCVSLFYCLAELQDQSLVEEIKSSFISSNRVTRKKFTPEQLSAITFVASTSEDLDLGDFNLKDYQQSSGPGLKPRPSTSKLEDSLLRLLPVIKLSAKANLGSCGLTWRSCEGLASILKCPLSSLRELDLCCNRNLQDSGVKRLCKGLENQDCKLEILRLADCGLNDKGFKYLASALKKNPPHLKELDLGQNYPGIDGVEMIASTLKDPECKLEILKMWCCGINEDGFGSLASALMDNPSYIRELDLNRNSPGDEGLKRLAEVLGHTECKLEKLCVSHEKRIQYDMGLDDMVRCETTGKSCEVLASALMANPFHLKLLDLGGSNLKDLPEAELLVALAEDPQNCLAELKL